MEPTTQTSTAAGECDYTLIARDDARYPPLLNEIHDPPAQLYVRGNPAALQQPQLAIVGSRRASVAALKLTEMLAGHLSRAGLSICSGLALGVDGAAHRGALAAGGTTVAVVGTGVDVLYPRQHRALMASLLVNGCVVSELPPGTRPRAYNFPKRNRLISGLSTGVLVVEAAHKSGSLITARCANEQGREVFALPWSLLHEGGKGCLQLIREGARLVLEPGDILEEVGQLVASTGIERQVESSAATSGLPGVEPVSLAADPTTPRERELMAMLGDRTCTLDELTVVSGWAVNEVMAVLSSLEIAGAVLQEAGGYSLT